jgi:hypothetical protein
MRFRIEFTSVREDIAYVLARQLDDGEFGIHSGSRLGGVRVRAQLSQPRRILPGGKPDLRVFGFALVEPSDIAKLEIGQVVHLFS